MSEYVRRVQVGHSDWWRLDRLCVPPGLWDVIYSRKTSLPRDREVFSLNKSAPYPSCLGKYLCGLMDDRSFYCFKQAIERAFDSATSDSGYDSDYSDSIGSVDSVGFYTGRLGDYQSISGSDFSKSSCSSERVIEHRPDDSDDADWGFDRLCRISRRG